MHKGWDRESEFLCKLLKFLFFKYRSGLKENVPAAFVQLQCFLKTVKLCHVSWKNYVAYDNFFISYFRCLTETSIENK